MKSRKLLCLFSLFLSALGLFFGLQTLPAHSQGNPASDLALQKSVASLTVLEPGDEIQYTLTFSNAGILTATNVLISDTLPLLLTEITITSTLPLPSTGNAWAVGDLPPGQGGIITLTAHISPALTSEFTFTNTATINSPITDTHPANNTSAVVSEINLPPVVVAGPDTSATEGQPFTLSAAFSDPGVDDTHVADIVWGDGMTGTLTSVTSPFTTTHIYTATGVYTVTLLVTDSDSGQGCDSLIVNVEKELAIHILYLPAVANFYENPMKVVTVFPLANSILAHPQGDLLAIYGTSMATELLPETVTPASVILHSFQSGDVTGTLSVTGNQLLLSPSRILHAGETLQATLTIDIGSLFFGGGANIYPDMPTVWQFQVKTSDGSGYMMPGVSPSFEGGNSTDLKLGDLDGDEDWDVVVANQDGPASVWLNDSMGGFSPHPITPVFGTGGAQAVVLGDVDRDGDVDALMAIFTAETVWLNDGLGNFSPHPTVPDFGTGLSTDLALGDLNGDGFLDAVVAKTNSEPETTWLNDGTGAFFAHSTIPSFGGEDSTGLALGDVDGDFDLDMVVANTNGEPETVWLNDGTGAFSAHSTTPSFGAGISQAIRLGDLDGDGDVDAVVANQLGDPETVWLNDGLGNFSPHPVSPDFGVGNSTDLALGDVEGDGDLDVIVANALGEPETIWLNNGLGEMTASPGTPAFGEGDSQAVVLGDLDQDGDLEVVIANRTGAETLWRSKNAKIKVINTTPDGNGGLIAQNGSILVTFDSPVMASTVNTVTFAVRGTNSGNYPGLFSFPAPNQVQFTPALPFLPGENLMITLSRMILSEEGLPLQPFTWSVRAEASGGTGNLTQHPSSPFGLGIGWDIAFGDLDGDRDLDAIIPSYQWWGAEDAFIWINDGSGNLTPHTVHPGLSVYAFGVALGDLDQDGDLDAIFAGQYASTIWLNDGTGGFSPHPTFPNFGEPSVCIDIQLGDLDGDGDLDAVCANGSGQVWLNDGTGVFSPHPEAFSFGDYEIGDHFSLADFDQDGDLDIVATANDGATLWVNGGNGNFTRHPVQPDFGSLGLSLATLVLGDLDGDQDIDILMGADTFAEAAVWLNDGAGHFTLHPTTPRFGGSETERIGLGDMDGDGDLDALFATPGAMSTLWVNDGLGNFMPHPTFPVFAPEGGFVAGAGDLDGDGDLDVLLTGVQNNTIWINQNE